MGRFAFCTISTSSHLFKVHTLFKGLDGLTNADMHCLVTDAVPASGDERINFHALDGLSDEVAVTIKSRYTGNELRWATKPLFISHLLQLGYERVIYVDNDIYFIASPDFLFEKLGEVNMFLTPHYYPADPKEEQFWLEANFRVGLYNAGCVGANSNAIGALNWWAQCCAYNVKKSAWRGLFDDQKYLDLIPVLFDKVEVLKHHGCNVAGWNKKLSVRSLGSDNKLVLNGKWPLVFIHFNVFTFRAIMKGWDPLLEPFLKTYVDQLTSFNPRYVLANETRLTLADYSRYVRHLVWKMVRVFE